MIISGEDWREFLYIKLLENNILTEDLILDLIVNINLDFLYEVGIIDELIEVEGYDENWV